MKSASMMVASVVEENIAADNAAIATFSGELASDDHGASSGKQQQKGFCVWKIPQITKGSCDSELIVPCDVFGHFHTSTNFQS